ncbi:1105_t:CDS:1, partial [Gigaspora rosea]
NGTEPTTDEDMIQILKHMVIDWRNKESLNSLIREIYPRISLYS